MDPVVDEKAPENKEGLSYDVYFELLENYPSLSYETCCKVLENYPGLVGKCKELLKRDEVSQRLIKDLRSDNKNLNEKLENAKKSMQEFKDANTKLKAKTNQQEKEIRRLNYDVSRLNKGLIQSAEEHQNISRDLKAEKADLKIKIDTGAKECLEATKRCMKLKEQLAKASKSLKLKTEDNKLLLSEVNALKHQIVEVEKKSDIELYEDLSVKMKSLETNLKQQEAYTCTADVQSYMDQLREASDKVISDLKIQHGLEKDVIRIDLKNKAKVLLELQKEVHKLKEANHLLNGIAKSVLKEEAVLLKNESRKGTELEFLKYLPPDSEELLKKLAVLKEKRRKGEASDYDDVECGDSKNNLVGCEFLR